MLFYQKKFGGALLNGMDTIKTFLKVVTHGNHAINGNIVAADSIREPHRIYVVRMNHRN